MSRHSPQRAGTFLRLPFYSPALTLARLARWFAQRLSLFIRSRRIVKIVGGLSDLTGDNNEELSETAPGSRRKR